MVEKALSEGAEVSIIDIEEEARRAPVTSLFADDLLFFARRDTRFMVDIGKMPAGAVENAPASPCSIGR
jgi:hypothetical protein